MDHKFFKFIFAFSIAFILQSSLRFVPGIGIGEICLSIIIIYTIFLCFKEPSRIPTIRSFPFVYLICTYVFVILFLITALNFYLSTPGNSFRDFFAYSLSALMLFSLAVHKEKVIDIAILLVPVTIALITIQYFFGDYSSLSQNSVNDTWYLGRFTGGARNPNQLALYLVCLISISLIFIKQSYLKYPYIASLIFYGLLSFSDAFLAYLLIFGISYVGLKLYPKKYSYLGVSGYLLIASLISLLFYDQTITLLSEEWQARDEGNARFILYMNGLKAWMSNPFSLVFGNGAGNFSGLYSSFEVFEAHNGPIDTLAMGGVIGLFVFFWYPLKLVVKSFLINERLFFAISLGILFFSLFHFLMRHPIYWFTLFIMYIYMQNKINLRKECAE